MVKIIFYDRVNAYLLEKESLLNEQMVKNYKRFVNNDYDETYFLEKVNIIRSFFEQRHDYVINYLNQHIPE